MKKLKCICLILSALLLMQSVIVPMAAEAETMQTEPTETEQALMTQTEELPRRRRLQGHPRHNLLS